MKSPSEVEVYSLSRSASEQETGSKMTAEKDNCADWVEGSHEPPINFGFLTPSGILPRAKKRAKKDFLVQRLPPLLLQILT